MSSSATPSNMRTLFVKRSVSPLEAEPITVAPEDVLCPGSDEDDSFEIRQSKRRRIEAQGKRYLEDKPLFILSAGLRGPLDGWTNPYKRRLRHRRGGILRKPENRNIVDLTQLDPEPVIPRDDAVRNAIFQEEDIHAKVASELEPKIPTAFPEPNAQVHGKSTSRGDIALEHILGPPSSKDWLRSDKTYLNSGLTRISKPPSPTPTVRRQPHTLPESRVPPLKELHIPLPKGTLDSIIPSSGFTPINKPTEPTTISDDPTSRSITERNTPGHSSNIPEQIGARYRTVFLADADNATQNGLKCAKALSQEAIRKTQSQEGLREALRLSQQAVLQASQAAIALETSQNEDAEQSPAMAKSSLKQDAAPAEPNHVARMGIEKFKTKTSKHTPRAVPPSSTLPSFRYKIARKEKPVLESIAILSPFAQQLEAAKAIAEAKTIKHLSFTSSGGIRSFKSRSSSRTSSAEVGRSRLNQGLTLSQEDSHKKLSLSQTNPSNHANGAETNPPSDVLPQGPEAQQVQPPAGPSGPSTDLLETDKQSLNFPTTDEGDGDSYINLSTQAALLKAQQSFDETTLSLVHGSPSHGVVFNQSQLSPTAYKVPQAKSPAVPLPTRPGNADALPMTPSKEPLSTQAMLDAISPFALTTVKKNEPTPTKVAKLQKRASFASSPLASPILTYGTTRRSLSMSTSSDSPSPTPERGSPRRTPASRPPPILSKTSTGISKPTSTATSLAFSIAPNGTLTEVYQQDGQQQYDPVLGSDSGWDLDQALDEAGNFLETLDVEAEARKGGTALYTSSG